MEVQAVPRVAVAGRTGMVSSRGLRVASDARLVALVREGNRAAFERIYDRYHHPILSFCRHMLGDPEEAADAVQHTFLAAYNAITSSDKPILLRAWLFTIARNRCYSVLRARREQPAAELAEPSTEGLASQVQRREDLRQLLADVRRLPDDQRAALVLAELGTLNHREIGSALGVPPAKVKALVFQARESLIASRVARDTDCTEIRRQLSTLRGGALRRVHLRRHLRDCEACREYRTHVERQRRGLAAILPVIPPLALKEVVLGGTAGAGTAATAVAGGGLLAFKGLALKGALCAVFALAGTAGTFALIHAQHSHRAAGLVPASVAPISGPVAPASVDAAGVARSRPVSHHARPSILDRRRSKHHSVRRTAVRATAIPAGLLRHTVPAAPSRRASVVRHGHPSGARRHVHHPPTPAPRPSPPPAPAGGGTQATSGGQQGPGGQSGQGGQGGGTQQGQGGGNGQGPGGGTGQGPGGGDGQGQGGGGPGGDNGGGGGGIGGPGGGQGGPGGGQGGPGGGQGNPEGGQGGPGGGQGNWQGEPGNPQGQQGNPQGQQGY